MKDIKCTQCDFAQSSAPTYLKTPRSGFTTKQESYFFAQSWTADFQTTHIEHLRRHIDRISKIAASHLVIMRVCCKESLWTWDSQEVPQLAQCDQCSYSTVGTNYIGFKSHLEQHQAGGGRVKYSCTQCVLHCKLTAFAELSRVPIPQQNLQLLWPVRLQKTKRKDRFRDHMNKLKKDCSSSTASATSVHSVLVRLSMKQHVNKVHNKPVIKCDQCDYSTDRTPFI